jgi:hypothetical protein
MAKYLESEEFLLQVYQQTMKLQGESVKVEAVAAQNAANAIKSSAENDATVTKDQGWLEAGSGGLNILGSGAIGVGSQFSKVPEKTNLDNIQLWRKEAENPQMADPVLQNRPGAQLNEEELNALFDPTAHKETVSPEQKEKIALMTEAKQQELISNLKQEELKAQDQYKDALNRKESKTQLYQQMCATITNNVLGGMGKVAWLSQLQMDGAELKKVQQLMQFAETIQQQITRATSSMTDSTKQTVMGLSQQLQETMRSNVAA